MSKRTGIVNWDFVARSFDENKRHRRVLSLAICAASAAASLRIRHDPMIPQGMKRVRESIVPKRR
jgi:hypothetical protein